MKSIVFDAGPVISLTTNNLLWTLDYLKEIFDGQFYVPPAVKGELVDRPLQSKRFKFEALQVNYRIRKGVLTVIENEKISALAHELHELSNHLFKTRGNWLTITHYAEMEVLATAIVMNSDAVVIDERTTKLLVEDPPALVRMLGKQIRSKIFLDKQKLSKIQSWTKNIKVLRSVELVMIAYEKGVLDKYMPDDKADRTTLVESLLWGVKLHGCALTREEISDLVKLETSGTGGKSGQVSRPENQGA